MLSDEDCKMGRLISVVCPRCHALGHEFYAIDTDSTFVADDIARYRQPCISHHATAEDDLASQAAGPPNRLSGFKPHGNYEEETGRCWRKRHTLLSSRRHHHIAMRASRQYGVTFHCRTCKINPLHIINQLCSLFAHSDTSAGAISTLVYFISTHPKIQEHVGAEVL